MLLTLWARVEDYLYDHVGIEPLSSAKEEKKHLSVLLESETFLVALLCLLSDEHYSAGSLVDAMVGVNASADQRGNARKWVITTDCSTTVNGIWAIQWSTASAAVRDW